MLNKLRTLNIFKLRFETALTLINYYEWHNFEMA